VVNTLCNGHHPSRWLKDATRLKTAACRRSKIRAVKIKSDNQLFVRRPVTGFTLSIKPSDCPTELGGELGILMVTVESASILRYDGF
jgi:hypothetical protein